MKQLRYLSILLLASASLGQSTFVGGGFALDTTLPYSPTDLFDRAEASDVDGSARPDLVFQEGRTLRVSHDPGTIFADSLVELNTEDFTLCAPSSTAPNGVIVVSTGSELRRFEWVNEAWTVTWSLSQACTHLRSEDVDNDGDEDLVLFDGSNVRFLLAQAGSWSEDTSTFAAISIGRPVVDLEVSAPSSGEAHSRVGIALQGGFEVYRTGSSPSLHKAYSLAGTYLANDLVVIEDIDPARGLFACLASQSGPASTAPQGVALEHGTGMTWMAFAGAPGVGLMQAGDIDGDGKDDLTFQLGMQYRVAIALRQPSGAPFDFVNQMDKLDIPGFSHLPAFGNPDNRGPVMQLDFDGDNDLDLMVPVEANSEADEKVHCWRNSLNDGTLLAPSLGLGAGPQGDDAGYLTIDPTSGNQIVSLDIDAPSAAEAVAAGVPVPTHLHVRLFRRRHDLNGFLISSTPFAGQDLVFEIANLPSTIDLDLGDPAQVSGDLWNVGMFCATWNNGVLEHIGPAANHAMAVEADSSLNSYLISVATAAQADWPSIGSSTAGLLPGSGGGDDPGDLPPVECSGPYPKDDPPPPPPIPPVGGGN